MGWLDRLRRAAPEPPPGPLAELAAAPEPDPATPLAEVELLALDLETTGLDPRRHELLSVGLVPVQGYEVRLAGARQLGIRPRGEVGGSAVLHGLTDDALAGEPPLEKVLPAVLAALTGGGENPRRRVLLAHFAQVETAFLAAACREVYGTTLPVQVVDTLELERRLLGIPVEQLVSGQVRLHTCRRRRGLPRYRAHSAGTDALACAELYLAQAAELGARLGRPPTLADVLRGRPKPRK